MRMGRRGRRLGVSTCVAVEVQRVEELKMDLSLVRARREEYR